MNLDGYHSKDCAQAAIVSEDVHSFVVDFWECLNHRITVCAKSEAAINQAGLLKVNHIRNVFRFRFGIKSTGLFSVIESLRVTSRKLVEQIKLISAIKFHNEYLGFMFVWPELAEQSGGGK